MSTTSIVVADLDRLLPVVSDLPSQGQVQLAYALGMLAADMTAHAPSNHLLAICAHQGLAPQDAEHLARGLACLVVRVAQRMLQE